MEKNKAAQDLAKKRNESLTPERRKEIAMTGARKRWGAKTEAPAPLPGRCAEHCAKLHEHVR